MEIEQDNANEPMEAQGIPYDYEKERAAKEAEYQRYREQELLKSLYKVDSQYSNEFYIKVLEGGVIFRITFCERDSDTGELYPRSAVDITGNGLSKIYLTIGSLLQSMVPPEDQGAPMDQTQMEVQRNRAPE